MVKHWTDKELTEKLKKLTILCDTREQDRHVSEYLEKNKIPTTTRKLDVGDYSCQLEDVSFERDIAVERKHNLDEICGNFTAERERFEREFLRAKAYGTKVHLIIENASWSDVFLGNYRSKFPAKSLAASLLSWMVRFNVSVTFCKPNETGRIIYGIMYYHVREKLLYG